MCAHKHNYVYLYIVLHFVGFDECVCTIYVFIMSVCVYLCNFLSDFLCCIFVILVSVFLSVATRIFFLLGFAQRLNDIHNEFSVFNC